MMDKDLEFKKEIVFYAKLLDEKGLVNPLEGNISIFDRESGKLYITPSGMRKSLLTPDMIAVMKDGEQIDGTKKRSSEYLLHEAALRSRPDCNAVVHTHAPHLTAFAYCNKPIQLRCSATFGLLFEDIPCLPFGQPSTKDIANGLEDAMKDHDMVLLGNHGCVCVGSELEKAVAFLEAGEEVMKIYTIAKSIGEIHDIPEEEWEKMCNTHAGSKRNRYK
ncbi:class II aldolase/adducin family protein [Anaerosinus massiliensis]|uniref:class II aldolase/adducin family protein n=1 Tax=Massilibacillus massiliensis TaxID=1806837 RepID=UPI000DA6058C|nr:class II aldolase/adducin family protein [Massilibacillus massiliensis]